MAFSESSAKRLSNKWKDGDLTYSRTFKSEHERVDKIPIAFQKGEISSKLSPAKEVKVKAMRNTTVRVIYLLIL